MEHKDHVEVELRPWISKIVEKEAVEEIMKGVEYSDLREESRDLESLFNNRFNYILIVFVLIVNAMIISGNAYIIMLVGLSGFLLMASIWIVMKRAYNKMIASFVMSHYYVNGAAHRIHLFSEMLFKFPKWPVNNIISKIIAPILPFIVLAIMMMRLMSL